MGAVSWKGPSGGGSIKTVQRGVYTTTFNIGEATKDVTITAVNTDNALAERMQSHVISNDSRESFSIELINSTTIRFTRNSTTTAITPYLTWTVTEYRGVKSKQTGNDIYTSTAEQTKTITSVDVNKVILVSTIDTASNGTGQDNTARVISSTSLGLKFPSTASTTHRWQLLEFF